MADGLPALVSNVAAAMPKVEGVPIRVNATQVINDKKVSDHHAVIPTANFKEAALTGLPAGERAVLELVALRLLCAVVQSYEYTETAVTLEWCRAQLQRERPHGHESRLAGADGSALLRQR